MNRHQLKTLEDERRYYLRLTALCLQYQRETGLYNHPALFSSLAEIKQRITSKEESVSKSKKTLSYEEKHEIVLILIVKQQLIFTAINELFQTTEWYSKNHQVNISIEYYIQIILREIIATILILSPLFKKTSEGGQALERLKMIRSYLQKKLTDLHFLSPNGLRHEQEQIFLQEQRRLFKYLGELKTVINELIEIVRHTDLPEKEEER